MTSDAQTRLQQYEEILRRFASGVRATQLYASDHPLLTRNVEGLLRALRPLHAHQETLAIGIVDQEFVLGDTPMPKASAGMKELLERLKVHGMERISVDRGVTAAELIAFMADVASLGRQAAADRTWTSPHIRAGRITGDDQRHGGIASDMATIRRLYANAVAAAEVTWQSAALEGTPDLPAARQAVEELAEAIVGNRTALVALTAMRSYDEYTFTHMVNVTILTMGQAQTLGIDGRLLREFGLSALMHDIGKVRTPSEILNKPEQLTPAEFDIMRRHPVDGAEILRHTPEMPILAPVVAFEHHLRLDGSGYPHSVRRDTLNLGTQLCSVADVYDAMRSQRAYQQAFPSDRVLEVLRRNNGTQFDQHLVRRFVQLLGIYPPGTLVRLNTREVGVVLQVHAPDPYRPRVRVLFDGDSRQYEAPDDRNLWETAEGPDGGQSVLSPVEPADFAIDPLTFLEVR